MNVPVKRMNKFQVYGFLGIFKLLVNLLRTKLILPKARILRFPIEIRGKKFIDFGWKLTTGIGCRIEAFPILNSNKIIKIGNNIEINDYVHIAGIESIILEDNVLIASKVFISDIQHGTYSGDSNHDSPNIPPRDRKLSSKPVLIKKNVWIGESVSILPGVTIGEGAIIGSNSVVSKNIPPNTIAVGNPAIPIKMFDFINNKWVKI